MLRYRHHKGELNTHGFTVISRTALHVCGLCKALLTDCPQETKDRGQRGQEALQNDPTGTGQILSQKKNKNTWNSNIRVTFADGIHLRWNKDNIDKHGTLGGD